MKQRRRIYYSAAQQAEIWDRWQAGGPMMFDRATGSIRESSSVFSVISPTRRQSTSLPVVVGLRSALGLGEREEVSRGLSTGCSLRGSLACWVDRRPRSATKDPTHGVPDRYRAAQSDPGRMGST